tara:strand:+ start:2232 stop:3128 length:897 start_codon:yes stop_codon:yes gene_type:complete
MSDPVTNVEIEDVLSSIRRLVAQGDKPRGAVKAEENKDSSPAAQVARFVLTPALRVAEPTEDVAEDVVGDLPSESGSHAAQFAAPPSPPLVLTASDTMQEPLVHDRMSATERESLEATIAELEAAVTSQPDEWEPDGSEVTPTDGLAVALAAMVEAELADAVNVAVDPDSEDDIEVEDAEIVASDPVVTLHPRRAEPTFRHKPVDVEVALEDEADTDYGDELRDNSDDDGMRIPDDLDETLAAYIAGGTKLDQEEMRQMVVDAVRQELQGDLGERITRNIRKLVRLEISRATSENLYD